MKCLGSCSCVWCHIWEQCTCRFMQGTIAVLSQAVLGVFLSVAGAVTHGHCIECSELCVSCLHKLAPIHVCACNHGLSTCTCREEKREVTGTHDVTSHLILRFDHIRILSGQRQPTTFLLSCMQLKVQLCFADTGRTSQPAFPAVWHFQFIPKMRTPRLARECSCAKCTALLGIALNYLLRRSQAMQAAAAHEWLSVFFQGPCPSRRFRMQQPEYDKVDQNNVSIVQESHLQN